MHKIAYPLQYRLFQKIVQQHRDYASAVAQYQKRYTCSRSKAYAIFKGERAIDGDHFISLMSEYHLHDLDVWPEGWPDTHFMVTAPSLQPDLDAYLNMLKHDFSDLNKKKEAHLYHIINELPLLLLKTRRRLAAFLLFYHFKYEHLHPDFKTVAFGSKFMHNHKISRWLDGCRDALQLYHEIPGTEYWSPRMLDSLALKIKYIKEFNDYEDAQDYQHLSEEIGQLVDELEDIAFKGVKHSGAAVQVFNHHGLLRNNVMIGKSEDFDFLYQDYGLLDLHRYTSKGVIHTRFYPISCMNDTLSPLSNAVKGRRNFFIELKGSIAKLLS
jgi:hypothetical protein